MSTSWSWVRPTTTMMAAAKLCTFRAAPTLAARQVTAADTTAKTLMVDAQGSEHDGHEQRDNPDGSNPSIAVDADIVDNVAVPAASATSSSSSTTPGLRRPSRESVIRS